jgi:large subunit ribosomal protein L12
MEYVYTAMLLHSAGKEVTEENVTKVLDAAGAKPDAARVKALIASLKDINIEEAIEKAAVPAAAPAAAAPAEASAEKKEEKKEEDKGKTEEEAAEGLGALFG